MARLDPNIASSLVAAREASSTLRLVDHPEVIFPLQNQAQIELASLWQQNSIRGTPKIEAQRNFLRLS